MNNANNANNQAIVDYVKKSFELKNQGFFKPAIEMLYKALSLDGDNLEILAQLAHLYTLLGNSDRAVYYIEKVLDLDSKHLDCLNLLEEIYLNRDNLKLAKDVSEKIYDIQPTPKNLAKKINILNKLQDFDGIEKLESSVVEFDDEVFYELACAYYKNYDFSKAFELLKSGFEKNNKNEKIILFLGKIYYDNKDFTNSKKMFMNLEKINPTAEVLNYLGLLKLEEKNISEAISYFKNAQKSDNQNSEYVYNLASAYFLNGWLDEAAKCFNQAICLNPDNINYHYSLAYLHYQKKAYDKALNELKFINTIEQHHELSNVLNAMIIGKKGDLLAAKTQLENIVKHNKEDDYAYSALSEIYKELSLTDLAKKAIKHAIELNPSSVDYLSELLELEFNEKNYEEASKLAEEILKLNEKYLYAHIILAKINLEQKNLEQVFEIAQDIIELAPSSPEGYYYNALALFEQGDKDFAVASLKKAISIDLNNALLYAKMSEFYQELGDFKLALEWAKEASEIDSRNYKYKWLCAKLAATLCNQDEAVKYYSQSYRLANFDKDLSQDYAKYLTSIGKEKQAKKILNH